MSYTNWDLVLVKDVFPGERGLFAKTRIRRSTVLGCFDGRATLVKIGKDNRLEMNELGHKEILQVRRVGDWIIGLAWIDSYDGIDLINHSCQANASVLNKIVVTAKRTIMPGEQITIDYRKWDIVPEGISCWCEPAKCTI